MPKLWIAGDSTAAKKQSEKRPESGWGEFIHLFIPSSWTVMNIAENGRSTKSFIDLGLLDQIDQGISKGDVLLIQFGHNDQKVEDPTRYTDPEITYKQNLLTMIHVAIKHQATPILLTSCTRRNFLSEFQIDPSAVGPYPEKMRDISNQHHTPLIDVFKMTQAYLSTLGDEKSKGLFLHLPPNKHINYPEGIIDNTHFNPEGAKKIASMIANELITYLNA